MQYNEEEVAVMGEQYESEDEAKTPPMDDSFDSVD